MAQIVLSGEELVSILRANGLIPAQVAAIETAGEEVRLRVRTRWPLVKSIRVALRFAGFERGEVVLQLVTNRLLDTFDWLVDRMVAALQDHGGRWEYPRLYVNVNQLLRRQVRGVEITHMAFRDGCLQITTSSADDGQPPRDAGDALPMGPQAVSPPPARSSARR
jgi:hypothetical protein